MTEKRRSVIRLRNTVRELVLQHRAEGGMAVVNAIVDHPRAISLIRSLEPEELYLLLTDLGRSDCLDLVRWVAQEQLQGLLDLDCWSANSFLPDRLENWVALIGAGEPDEVDRFFEGLTDEVAVLYLKKRVTIVARTFEPEQDDEISALGMEVLRTPDDLYYLLLPPGSPHFPAVKYFIDRLYDRDHLDAAALLRHARFEDRAELEEEERQARVSRVAAMGFPTPEEADELLAYVNPVEVREQLRTAPRQPLARPPASSLLPELLEVAGREPPFLAEALRHLDSPRVTIRLRQAAIFCANNLMVNANRGDLADSSGRERWLKRALATLSVGLEFLAEKERERAAEILRTQPPRTIFQCGNSLTLMVRQQALECMRHSGREVGLFLFDPPLDGVITCAAQNLPTYFLGIDRDDQTGERDFLSLADLSRTRAALEQALGVARFVTRTLRLDPAALAPAVAPDLAPLVRHTALMATALVNALLGHDDLLRPLPELEVPRVLDLLFPKAGGPERPPNPKLEAAVSHFAAIADNPFAAALLALSLRKLQELARRFPSGLVPDLRYLLPTLLVQPAGRG